MEKIITPSGNLKSCHLLSLAFLGLVTAMVRTNLIDWWLLFAKQAPQPFFKPTNYLYSAGLLLGVLLAGWGADHLFHGKRWKTIILFAIGMLLLLLAFWLLPQNTIIHYYSLFLVGISFLVYGLHILILITIFESAAQKIRGFITAAMYALILIAPALSHFFMAFIIKLMGFAYFSSILWPSLCIAVVLSALGIWHSFSAQHSRAT